MNQILVIDDNEDFLKRLRKIILNGNTKIIENITLKNQTDFEYMIKKNLVFSANIIFIAESVIDFLKSKNETIEYFQQMKELYKSNPFIVSYSGRGVPQNFFGNIYISKIEFYSNIMNPLWLDQIVS